MRHNGRWQRCGALLVLIVSAEAAGEQEHASITQKTQNTIVLCFTVKLGTGFLPRAASWSAASLFFGRCQKVLRRSPALLKIKSFMMAREVCKKFGVLCAECTGVEIDCVASIELAKSFSLMRILGRNNKLMVKKCTNMNLPKMLKKVAKTYTFFP